MARYLILLLLAPLARAEEPWFRNVSASLGLGGVEGKRVKWIDFDGDGWTDMLVMSADGRAQLEAMMGESTFVGTSPNRFVARRDWKGAPARFAGYDLDRDGFVSERELRRLVRTRLWSAYRSEKGARFTDVTASLNLRGRAVHMLVAGDIDDDGDWDLYASGYATQDPSNVVETPEFFFRWENGSFRRFDPPVAMPVSTVCGACFLDFDRDGKLDLFTGSWYRDFGNGLASYPDRLYRGDGKGGFVDVTKAAGLMLPHAKPGDSLPDPRPDPIPDELRARIGRQSHRPTYGVAAADWDNDGDLDLFTLSYGRQWNLHWRNEGDGTFVEIGEQTVFDGDAVRHGRYPEDVRRRGELPFRSNGNSFDCAFGDYDNDGRLDVIVSEYTHRWAGESSDVTEILTNMGAKFRRETGALERVHEVRNWNHGDFNVAWIDFDNDGRLDLLVSSSVYPDRNVLEAYHQKEPGTFTRVTEAIGLDWPDSTQLSLADFDRDGDLDVLAGNNPHPTRAAKLPRQVAVWRNEIANRSGNTFVSLSLRGKGWRAGGSNRMAIGARITIKAGGLLQVREVSGGHGHVGHQDDVRQVIGLGKAKKIDELTVRWCGPGSPTQTFRDVEVGRFYRLVEGGELTNE
ncbi:MAG: CRTAC1 family protein [Planctomycetota bacterium]